jgi:hypothetical protein
MFKHASNSDKNYEAKKLIEMNLLGVSGECAKLILHPNFYFAVRNNRFYCAIDLIATGRGTKLCDDFEDLAMSDDEKTILLLTSVMSGPAINMRKEILIMDKDTQVVKTVMHSEDHEDLVSKVPLWYAPAGVFLVIFKQNFFWVDRCGKSGIIERSPEGKLKFPEGKLKFNECAPELLDRNPFTSGKHSIAMYSKVVVNCCRCYRSALGGEMKPCRYEFNKMRLGNASMKECGSGKHDPKTCPKVIYNVRFCDNDVIVGMAGGIGHKKMIACSYDMGINWRYRETESRLGSVCILPDGTAFYSKVGPDQSSLFFCKPPR